MPPSTSEEFLLEISGEGETITLEPVGVVDAAGARMLLEALSVLGRNAIAYLQVRLDRVTSVTEEAFAALRAGNITVPIGLVTVSYAERL